MKQTARLATPPAKPVLIYDGNCNFCKFWIRRWQRLTGDAVAYLPSQDPQVTARFPEIPQASFDESVQFIDTAGSVFAGAEAVFRSLGTSGKRQWLLRGYQRSRAFAGVTEWAYRFIARHRTAFSRLTRVFFGRL